MQDMDQYKQGHAIGSMTCKQETIVCTLTLTAQPINGDRAREPYTYALVGETMCTTLGGSPTGTGPCAVANTGPGTAVHAAQGITQCSMRQPGITRSLPHTGTTLRRRHPTYPPLHNSPHRGGGPIRKAQNETPSSTVPSLGTNGFPSPGGLVFMGAHSTFTRPRHSYHHSYPLTPRAARPTSSRSTPRLTGSTHRRPTRFPLLHPGWPSNNECVGTER